MGENHIFVREEALQEQEGNASHLCGTITRPLVRASQLTMRWLVNDEVVGVRGGVGER
jgi:hypothetical protein